MPQETTNKLYIVMDETTKLISHLCHELPDFLCEKNDILLWCLLYNFMLAFQLVIWFGYPFFQFLLGQMAA